MAEDSVTRKRAVEVNSDNVVNEMRRKLNSIEKAITISTQGVEQAVLDFNKRYNTNLRVSISIIDDAAIN